MRFLRGENKLCFKFNCKIEFVYLTYLFFYADDVTDK